MGFNPLAEKGIPLDRQWRDWSALNVTPYTAHEVDPYSRCRVITLAGIETESILFSHQFARHIDHLPTKQMLAAIRRVEQQQQKVVNWLIPGDETTLEVTIGYEQVAVDLTAWLARHEPDPYVKQALDFALLEDFDHLYRYANLYELLDGKEAETVTGQLTEIMPGRPTAVEHRFPHDDVRAHYDKHTVDPLSRLHVMTIVAAEQQTMNFYMTIGNRYVEPIARGLYAEIAMVEEQHVTHYESLLDPLETWCQQELFHHYNECYLYWSFLQQESDRRLKHLWEQHLHMEIEHVRLAGELLRQHEGIDPAWILPKELPEPIRFEPNKAYIRQLLASQVGLRTAGTQFVAETQLPADSSSARYQRDVNQGGVPSEAVIRQTVAKRGREYRLQTEGPHPIDQKQPRAA
jgi:hypothetical protein